MFAASGGYKTTTVLLRDGRLYSRFASIIYGSQNTEKMNGATPYDLVPILPECRLFIMKNEVKVAQVRWVERVTFEVKEIFLKTILSIPVVNNHLS